MNPKHHTRIITELSACEKQLDAVLFDSGDQAMGAAAATTGIFGAAGGLYAAGRGARLKKKILKTGLEDGNEFFKAPIGGAQTVAGDIIRGGKVAATGSKDLWQFLKNWGTRVGKAAISKG